MAGRTSEPAANESPIATYTSGGAAAAGVVTEPATTRPAAATAATTRTRTDLICIALPFDVK
ncbi:hypothetical protein GCM10028799_31110 [Kribbella italica]